MTVPTPQEAALKQALRDLVLAATTSGSSGMTHAKLASEANVSASTLSKASTPGNGYLPPAEITRDIVTACLRHSPATVTDTEVQAEVAKVEQLRRAASDADIGDASSGQTSGSRRIRRVVIPAFVVLAVVVVVAVVISMRVLSGSDTPVADRGGVDLTKFCRSYELVIRGETCVAEVDLTKACNSERGRTDLKGLYLSDDPRSGECFTPEDQSLGGIQNMTKYCEKLYSNLPITAATPDSHRWWCSLKIDMDVACVWQYHKLDLKATKDDNIWQCH